MPVLPSYRNQSIVWHSKKLTGFYMRATLAFNGLKSKSRFDNVKLLLFGKRTRASIIYGHDFE